MSELGLRALKSAAASSAMEGLPLDDNDMSIVMDILDGKMSLQDFFKTLKTQEQVVQ
jgi:hypothetical protein